MEQNIFKYLIAIFENVTGDIQNGLYQSSKAIFDNGFFNIAFAFAINCSVVVTFSIKISL